MWRGLMVASVLLVGEACAGAQSRPPGVPADAIIEYRPGVVSCPEPRYPRGVRGHPGGDSVQVLVLIDARGRVTPDSLRVLATTDSSLNRPALAVIRGCRYAPARINSERVRVWATEWVAFEQR